MHNFSIIYIFLSTNILYCLKAMQDSLALDPLPSMSTQTKSIAYEGLWRYCVYSILFPLCCIANHLNYIIIAFIHDLYHATSVAIVYGVVVLFFYGFLKQVSNLIGNHKYLIEKCKYNRLLIFKLILIQVTEKPFTSK